MILLNSLFYVDRLFSGTSRMEKAKYDTWTNEI